MTKVLEFNKRNTDNIEVLNRWGTDGFIIYVGSDDFFRVRSVAYANMILTDIDTKCYNQHNRLKEAFRKYLALTVEDIDELIHNTFSPRYQDRMKREKQSTGQTLLDTEDLDMLVDVPKSKTRIFEDIFSKTVSVYNDDVLYVTDSKGNIEIEYRDKKFYLGRMTEHDLVNISRKYTPYMDEDLVAHLIDYRAESKDEDCKTVTFDLVTDTDKKIMLELFKEKYPDRYEAYRRSM